MVINHKISKMKKIKLLVLVVLTLNLVSCDKEASAPQKVKDAFTQKFPNATDVDWSKESDTEWEAEFKMNEKEYSSNFTQDGTWKETEYKVTASEVPQVVMDAFNTNFIEYDTKKIEVSETIEGKVYEFIITKGETEMEVVIDTQGTIVKKEQKKEDKEDKEDNEDKEDSDND